MKKLERAKKKKINPRELQKKYLDHVERDLVDKGVVFFDSGVNLNIDEDFLILPPEITEVSSRDLGEYLNAFTQQKVYLRTILGRVELDLEIAKKNYFDAGSKKYSRLSKDKMTETSKERLINSDEEVKPYYEEFIESKRKVDLVKYSIENIEDILFMISREVTRRNKDFEDEMKHSSKRRY